MELEQLQAMSIERLPLFQIFYNWEDREVKADFSTGDFMNVHLDGVWIYDAPLSGTVAALIDWIQHLQAKRWVNNDLLIQFYLHWRFVGGK